MLPGQRLLRLLLLTSSTTPTKATHHHNSSTTGRLQVDETATAYPLSLDVPGGVQLCDLNIFVRALELKVKGKAYTFDVAAHLIHASGIAATWQPGGGLQMSVPKKLR